MNTVDLKTIRHLALDMDGTIYKGGTLFDFTPAFLARMRALGVGCTFLTNNSSRSVRDYLAHLRHMGIDATTDEIYTSSLCTIDYLRLHRPDVKKLYVLGTRSLRAEFTEAGFEVTSGDDEPDVVVAGFDTELVFDRLCKAAWWIHRGKPFIATHPDRTCPTDQPTVLVDCGSICAALQMATGRAPDVVLGKPDASMLEGILHRHNLQPHELGMVGDRLMTDMAMARGAGAVGILVLTGEATREDTKDCPHPPDLIVPSIKELGQQLADVQAMAGDGR
ncbi:MAG: HAD-IIA family hydrolase [Phycisphaerae bacterium]|nr:HAD-IIA family hydrolase [Phycisphaerae bacterium]